MCPPQTDSQARREGTGKLEGRGQRRDERAEGRIIDGDEERLERRGERISGR